MIKAEINTFRVEAKYAVVQGSYWSSYCALVGFVAVYLSFKGLTNTQIGFTSSLYSIISILIQFFISNFADSNTHILLKKIISAVYIVAVIGCAILWLIPVPIAITILVYSIATASQVSITGLISALLMQLSNVGLPVNYGWPRGIGSICYAISAYILGIMIENYSPGILMPVSIALAIIAIISISIMPDPNKIKQEYQLQSTEKKVTEHPTSYWEMIRSNPTLRLFLYASVLLLLGLSTQSVFLIRIIEGVGGSTKELGISMFIQSGVELPVMLASGWILKKFRTYDILVFSFFCYFIKSLALSIAPSVGIIYGIMVFSLFCMGLYGFASVLLVNNIVKASEIVRAQTIVILCMGIGGILGSSMAGSMIDSMGLKFLLTISWIILLVAALLMLVCRYLYLKHYPTNI
jgi:PPP family 3-phenylpropionic acid transporter